jgi:hypothetical protein
MQLNFEKFSSRRLRKGRGLEEVKAELDRFKALLSANSEIVDAF